MVAKKLETRYVELSPNGWCGLDVAPLLELKVFDLCSQVVMRPSVMHSSSLCLQNESESIFITELLNEQLVL